MSRPWTVYRPKPLVQIAKDLWSLEDEVPGIPGAMRRMTIARRADGTLLFYNGVPFPDDTRARVLALGKPAQLIVPNQFHALDVAAFAKELGLTAYGPDVAVTALADRLPLRDVKELPQDPGLQVFTVEGFKTHEAVLVVGEAERSLVVADLVTNQAHAATFNGLMMRLMNFSGPAPKLPTPVRMRVLEDRAKVKALYEQLASVAGLKRLVPSHGDVFEGDVPAALRDIAAKL